MTILQKKVLAVGITSLVCGGVMYVTTKIVARSSGMVDEKEKKVKVTPLDVIGLIGIDLTAGIGSCIATYAMLPKPLQEAYLADLDIKVKESTNE